MKVKPFFSYFHHDLHVLPQRWKSLRIMIVKIKPTSYQYSLHTVIKTHEGLTTAITLISGAELGYKGAIYEI